MKNSPGTEMAPVTRNRFEKFAFIIIAACVLYASVISTLNFIATGKVGYVNSNLMLENYPGAIAAREKLNAQMTEWQENIKTLEAELSQLSQELVDKGKKLDKKTLAEKNDALKKKQEDYLRYTRAIQEKAATLEQELMQPVFDEINVFITDYGEEEGYAIIFGTLSGGNILFAQDAADLTDEFLAYVKNKM